MNVRRDNDYLTTIAVGLTVLIIIGILIAAIAGIIFELSIMP